MFSGTSLGGLLSFVVALLRAAWLKFVSIHVDDVKDEDPVMKD